MICYDERLLTMYGEWLGDFDRREHIRYNGEVARWLSGKVGFKKLEIETFSDNFSRYIEWSSSSTILVKLNHDMPCVVFRVLSSLSDLSPHSLSSSTPLPFIKPIISLSEGASEKSAGFADKDTSAPIGGTESAT